MYQSAGFAKSAIVRDGVPNCSLLSLSPAATPFASRAASPRSLAQVAGAARRMAAAANFMSKRV